MMRIKPVNQSENQSWQEAAETGTGNQAFLQLNSFIMTSADTAADAASDAANERTQLKQQMSYIYINDALYILSLMFTCCLINVNNIY